MMCVLLGVLPALGLLGLIVPLALMGTYRGLLQSQSRRAALFSTTGFADYRYLALYAASLGILTKGPPLHGVS